MMGIGVFILPPGYNVSPSQATSPSVPPNTTYRYNVGYPYSSLVPIYPPK